MNKTSKVGNAHSSYAGAQVILRAGKNWTFDKRLRSRLDKAFATF